MKTRAIAVVCVLMAATALPAQEFRSGVDLVTIPIVVTGRGGAAITREISAADFRVFEDGVEQTVTLLDRQRLPTSVCILLDSSMSMRGWKQRLATAALEHLFRRFQPEDEVSVVSAAATVRLAVPWTPAPRIPRVDWDRWRVGGTTPLFDALQLALQVVNHAVNPRAVVLIVSDGLDNSSRISLSQLATTRRQSETLVYAVRTQELEVPVTPSGRKARSELFLGVRVGAGRARLARRRLGRRRLRRCDSAARGGVGARVLRRPRVAIRAGIRAPENGGRFVSAPQGRAGSIRVGTCGTAAGIFHNRRPPH